MLLSVYRDLVYWTLIAGLRNIAEREPGLATLWGQTPHEKLLGAAGNERNLRVVHDLLLDMTPLGSLDATDDDVGRVRSFADALYADLAAPRRRVVKVIAQRWALAIAVVAALVAVVIVLRGLVMGPNIATRGPMRTARSCRDAPQIRAAPRCCFTPTRRMAPGSSSIWAEKRGSR